MKAGPAQCSVNGLRVTKKSVYLELLCELLGIVEDESVYTVLHEFVETGDSESVSTVTAVGCPCDDAPRKSERADRQLAAEHIYNLHR